MLNALLNSELSWLKHTLYLQEVKKVQNGGTEYYAAPLITTENNCGVT